MTIRPNRNSFQPPPPSRSGKFAEGAVEGAIFFGAPILTSAFTPGVPGIALGGLTGATVGLVQGRKELPEARWMRAVGGMLVGAAGNTVAQVGGPWTAVAWTVMGALAGGVFKTMGPD